MNDEYVKRDTPQNETKQVALAHKLLADVERRARTNEGYAIRRLSDALTGGNAGTWDEIFHAAESVADTLKAQQQDTERLVARIERLVMLENDASLFLGPIDTVKLACAGFHDEASRVSGARVALDKAAMHVEGGE